MNFEIYFLFQKFCLRFLHKNQIQSEKSPRRNHRQIYESKTRLWLTQTDSVAHMNKTEKHCNVQIEPTKSALDVKNT